jgi:hypothetical protein
LSAKPRKQAAQLQAAAEGVQAGETAEFLGEKFRLAGKVGALPYMKLAAYDGTENTVASAAARYAMLKDTVHEDDWPRFEQHALDAKATYDDLWKFIVKCMEAVTARPTRPPSASSNGDSAASANSTATSSAAPAAG